MGPLSRACIVGIPWVPTGPYGTRTLGEFQVDNVGVDAPAGDRHAA